MFLEDKIFKYIVSQVRNVDVTACGTLANLLQREESDIEVAKKKISRKVLEAICRVLKSNNDEAIEIAHQIMVYIANHFQQLRKQLMHADIESLMKPLLGSSKRRVSELAKLLLDKAKFTSGEIGVIHPLCQYCKNRSEHTKVCSACKGVRYCSKECQKADWPQHKLKCADLKAYMESSPHVGTKTHDQDRTLALRYLELHIHDIEQLFQENNLGKDEGIIHLDMTRVPHTMRCLKREDYFKEIAHDEYGERTKTTVLTQMQKLTADQFIAVVLNNNTVSTFSMLGQKSLFNKFWENMK
jgi:hypothetical protein